jgi:TusA-related sulfurtransferase
MADTTLDLKGLNCPSSVIQTKKTMNGLFNVALRPMTTKS